MNGIKTFILMAIMTFLLMALGGALGGFPGLIMALVLAGIGNVISYWYSDKLVLKAYKAQPVSEEDWIYKLSEKLAKKADLPAPKVYIINQAQPNAFATGRNPNNAVVAVTKGLVEYMTKNELAGVIAHELGHIKNRDILISTVAATLAGAVSYLGYATRFGTGGRSSRGGNYIVFLVALLLAPFAASIIRMAISRTREYKADAFGARLSGNPMFLSSALKKLENWSAKIPMRGNPSTSHMFIVQPFSGKLLKNLFSTHPKTEERIKRLEAMNHKEDEWFIESNGRHDVESSNSSGENKGQFYREKNVHMNQNKETKVVSRNTKNETIAFYNLENFFDTKDDKGKDDAEYLPNSDKNWNLERYWTKVNHIADAILSIDKTGLPLIIGLAEVENKTVLNDLVKSEKIGNALRYVHFESEDRRGIDVALLYSKDKFIPLLEKQIKVKVPNEPYFVTRDILYVKGKLETGEKLHVFVNHWPSRREGPQKSQPRRLAAAFALRKEVAKIQERNENAKIIIMGDFNDFPINQSLSRILKGKKHRALKKDEFYNLAYLPYTKNRGTHHSRHGWSMFDQILISRSLLRGEGLITDDKSCTILDDKSIMFYDKRFEMYRPNRTYRGNKYHGGYSDHLPIYFNAKFKN